MDAVLMPPSEAAILARVLKTLGGPKTGVKLWRLNQARVGAWMADQLIKQAPALAHVRSPLTKACVAVGRRMGGIGLTPGASDLLGLSSDGRLVGVEIKAARGSLSEEQSRWLGIISKQRGFSCVIKAASLDDATSKATRALELIRAGTLDWEGWPYVCS